LEKTANPILIITDSNDKEHPVYGDEYSRIVLEAALEILKECDTSIFEIQ